MPQLDFGTYPAQVFWLVVSFTVLYVFVVRYVVPRSADIFERRKDAIERTLARGETLRNETAILMDEYESKLAQARRKNHQALLKAREKTARAVARMSAEAVASITEETEGARREIERTLAQARQEADPLAESLADKVLRALVPQDDRAQDDQAQEDQAQEDQAQDDRG